MPFGLSGIERVAPSERLLQALISKAIICLVIVQPAHVNSIKQPLKDTPLAPEGNTGGEYLKTSSLTS